MIRIDVQGTDEVRAALKRLGDRVRDESGEVVTKTALRMRTEVVKSIREPGTGRTYRKYNPTRIHRASSPGQPPATDTGRLINSIQFDQLGPLTATVGSDLIYAKYLEYGTRNMAARPFFGPAVERARVYFNKEMQKVIDRAGG